MNGKGYCRWGDGRSYRGVKLFIIISTIREIKNMVMGYLSGQVGGR